VKIFDKKCTKHGPSILIHACICSSLVNNDDIRYVQINKDILVGSDKTFLPNIVGTRHNGIKMKNVNEMIMACFLVVPNNLKKNNSINVRSKAREADIHRLTDVSIVLTVPNT
jgi:hypothetical protein